MLGLLAEIQRFSIHDGPGIRSTAFLQGCTLSCAWCHNPELIPAQPQLRYQQSRCIHCGNCQAVCPSGVHQVSEGQHLIDRSLCQASGLCVPACPGQALSLSSRQVSARQVADELLEDLPFYQSSGGGITLSGGEPLKQGEFAVEILRLCKQAGVHTALETALHIPQQILKNSLPHTDLYLADFKMEEGLFRWTGGNSRLIRDNLAFLYESGAQIILRCPIIPGINDTDSHLKDIAGLIHRHPGILGVELMAYHRLGSGKYREMGQEYSLECLEPMDQAQKQAFLSRAHSLIHQDVKWG